MKKFLPLVILLALLIPSFVYTIDEREQAIITEFGEFKRSVTTPGIHFKKPFVTLTFFILYKPLREYYCCHCKLYNSKDCHRFCLKKL